MKSDELLFLDFDGVLCDSLPETLVSSWIAFHSFVQNDQPASMPVDFRRAFARLRPFIRSGEDYLLVQDIISHGPSINDQAGFDELLARTGPARMAEYKEFFYRARKALLERDPAYWFSLNPVFPRLRAALQKVSAHQRIYILSTKRSDFIQKILEANRIVFLPENVIDSGNENKSRIISDLLDRTRARQAHFIDDQRSHLLGVTDNRIKLHLASWGYVKPEWLSANREYTILSMEEAAALMLDF